MKNILVTGHTGFLGKHLLKEIRKRFPEANVYVSNRSENNLLQPLGDFTDAKLDYIFHLSVDTKAGDYCLYHQGDQWQNNQLINTNILTYWRSYQPQAKMIAFGTSCAYQDNEELKTESKYLDGYPNERLYIYAMTKRMLLIGLEAYKKQFGMNYLYFIPNTLYGPDFEITDRHFIFEIMQKISAGKFENKEVSLWGSGTQKRELVYASDAVNKILDNLHLENERINLSSGVEYPIREYAALISSYIDFDFNKIKFDTDCYEGQLSKQLHPSEKIGACNQTPLLTGLKNTLKYYLQEKYQIKI